MQFPSRTSRAAGAKTARLNWVRMCARKWKRYGGDDLLFGESLHGGD